MGQKTTTPKVAPAAKATPKVAPAAKPATPKFTLRDYAEAVAKLSPQMRASNVQTRAKVMHENLGKLITGFAGGFNSLDVSCPFWPAGKGGVRKSGSYHIRNFVRLTPAEVAKEVAVPLRAKSYIK